MTSLRVHDMSAGNCPLLGPAFYVWVQGCPLRCPGCFNDAALDAAGPARVLSPDAIADAWRPHAGGLVLSGGEPFDQAIGLADVCRLVRRERPGTPILVYTGYHLDTLLERARSGWIDLLREVDVIVDGPYIRERSTNFALAGSDNQRVFFLSDRVPPSRWANVAQAQIQVRRTDDNRVRIIGTGGAGLDMQTLVSRMKDEGVHLEE